MAPKAPWNKSITTTPTNAAQLPNQPTASPASERAGAHTDYQEAQKDEFEALSAIYQDDFTEVETKGAWNKTSDRSFTLHLRASENEHVSIVLWGRFTATYPKTLPILAIHEPHAPSAAIQAIELLLKSKPKELLGEVMVYEIATAIVEILEDSAQSLRERREKTDAIPSLEEERAVKEAKAARQAENVQLELRRKKEAEEAEEAQGLQELVNREMSRRQQERRRRQRQSAPRSSPIDGTRESSSDVVDFQRPVTMAIEGVSTAFSTVDRVVQIRSGPITTVFTAQPVTAEAASIETCLILKKFRITAAHRGQETEVKQAVFSLEAELEKLKKLHHDSAINLVEFGIDYDDSTWDFRFLVDYANKGSLQEMLEMVASVPSDNVRIWTIQLLEALDFYHRSGVVHKRIHTNNVLISRSMATSGTAVKLSDAGFQDRLYDIVELVEGKYKHNKIPLTWIPPECAQEMKKTRKTDVFEAGVVFVQMLFGLDATQKYSSPATMINTLNLSEPLEEVLINFFKDDPRKRHDAFDLLPSEFFRSKAPIFEPGFDDRVPSMASLPTAFDRNNRARRGSNMGFGGSTSRYTTEWDELGRLGKGGYGEVVKARNKLDGRIYAIKKIVTKTPSDLTAILSEVMLLSRLNHAYVVRYYTAWPEEEFVVGFDNVEEDTTIDTTSTDELSFFMKPTLDFGPSSRGLDFVSSSGLNIKFGNDSDDSDDDEDSEAVESGEDSDTSDRNTQPDTPRSAQRNQLGAHRTTSSTRSTRPIKSTLYIQMEFCERHTLRDLIVKDLSANPEEGWRLLRQILEGLAHIHSQGIIHRDLKPDNVFIDLANNPKIGDFGLATSGKYSLSDKPSSSASAAGDMTRSVGTTLYVAPELSSQGGGQYNEKVDMFSLGIIFFEMCFSLKTAMERDRVIREIRREEHELPTPFRRPEKALQGEIIMSLINHKSNERPSSAELLRSNKIPIKVEDETFREALQSLSDSSSPYYQKIMSALFSQPLDGHVKDMTWDMGTDGPQGKLEDSTRVETHLLRGIIRSNLVSIFRRHGAIETQRPALFPLSHHYTSSSNDVFKLLDSSGCLVQLPYDLTLPNARHVSKQRPPSERTYAFGNVYRDRLTGGAPRPLNEADFDIVGSDSQDPALKEAETIKVVDEIVEEFPSLNSGQMCFHLNHSDLLEAVLEFCRIAKSQRLAVKDIISKLNIHGNTWAKIRVELRAPTVGVSSTSLDDLARFDFRDAPDKALKKILSLLEGTASHDMARAAITHLRKLLSYLKLFHVKSKIYICPLSSYNERFYAGGALFQCLWDNKNRDVLAAGGRYDRLVEEYRPKIHGNPFIASHAVGTSIGWDRLVSSMARHHRNAGKKQRFHKNQAKEEDETYPAALRRCDVLVASFDPDVLRSAGIRILSELWKHDISAELAVDARNVEELQTHYRDDKFNWIVMVKQDPQSSGGKPEIKVRNPVTRDETDLYTSNLVQYLLAQLRERDHREAASERDRPRQHTRHGTSGHSDPFIERTGSTARQDRTKVLFSHHRSKKSNKFQIVQAADARANELLASYASAPIIAVECGEQAMEKMRGVKISDTEGWKKLIQIAPLNERQYLGQIQEELEELASRAAAESTEGAAHSGENDEDVKGGVAFVYNFRTGACVLFDLMAAP